MGWIILERTRHIDTILPTQLSILPIKFEVGGVPCPLPYTI